MKGGITTLNRALTILLGLSLTGCESLDLRPKRADSQEFRNAMETKKAPAQPPAASNRIPQPPPEVADALLPGLDGSVAGRNYYGSTRRFDISVMAADAREFFMGLVADSNENVILHPNVQGIITISLKNVTLPEVLDAVREVYGYDYKRTAAGYVIYPAERNSRIYHVDYLNLVRTGRSETRVSGGQGSPPMTGASGMGGGYGGGGYSQYGGGGGGGGQVQQSSGNGGGVDNEEAPNGCRGWREEGSSQDEGGNSASAGRSSGGGRGGAGLPSVAGSVVATSSSSNLWRELRQALGVIVCGAEGSDFVVNQQTGVIIVQAFPRQLREVEQFLEALRAEIQRQVVLEAKILEVVLKDGYQAGINWASLIKRGEDVAVLTTLGGPTSLGQVFTVDFASATGINMGDFNAYIELLETQGEVHTLSNPRIATLNNQKAVIKVGTDELHISNVNPGSFANNVSGGGFAPSPVLSPYFSGISLDVTPQIDDTGRVTLHVHPSVTQVSDQDTRLDFGTGEQVIPLAVSTVRESDSVVHAQDGQVIIIGGLMQNLENTNRQGIAWLSRIPGVGSLFRRGQGDFSKTELVILLKPTIIHDTADWDRASRDARDRAQRLEGESRRDPLP